MFLPFEHYGKLQSEDAIRYAREILEFVRIINPANKYTKKS